MKNMIILIAVVGGALAIGACGNKDKASQTTQAGSTQPGATPTVTPSADAAPVQAPAPAAQQPAAKGSATDRRPRENPADLLQKMK